MVKILKELRAKVRIASKITDFIIRLYREDSTKIQVIRLEESNRVRNKSNEWDKTRVLGVNCAVQTDYIQN